MAKVQNEDVVSCKDLGGCKKGCCSTEVFYYFLDIDKPMPEVDEWLTDFTPPLLNLHPHWVHGQFHLEQPVLAQFYQPPIIVRDVSVLYQVFLC